MISNNTLYAHPGVTGSISPKDSHYMCSLGLTRCFKTPHFRHLRLSWAPFGVRILFTNSPWASPNLWQDPKLLHSTSHGAHPSIFLGLAVPLGIHQSLHPSINASSLACIHLYMHLYMHPETVHSAMEASSDCITKSGVQRYGYGRGWRVGFGYTAPMLNMFIIKRIRSCSLFTLNINIIKH